MTDDTPRIINPADERAAAFKRELANQKPHNLLLFTDTENRASHGNWNKAVDKVTPKGTAKKQWQENMAPQAGEKEGVAKREFDNRQIISMPPNFCIFCGNTDVPKEKQKCQLQILFNRDVSGLDIKEGSMVNATSCAACTHAIFFEKRESIVPDIPETEMYWKAKPLDRHAQAQDNICNFIWAQRQAGVTGTVFGDDVRRERHKDIDE